MVLTPEGLIIEALVPIGADLGCGREEGAIKVGDVDDL